MEVRRKYLIPVLMITVTTIVSMSLVILNLWRHDAWHEYARLNFSPLPKKASSLNPPLLTFSPADPQTFRAFEEELDGHLHLSAFKFNASLDYLKYKRPFRHKLKPKIPKFNVTEFQERSFCNKTGSYGYAYGAPCILLKLDRRVDWIPENYEISKIPPAIYHVYKRDHIAITCEPTHELDSRYVGRVVYYPKHGIPFKYFPYKGERNYADPLVWVQFRKPHPLMPVHFICKAWAKNIRNDEKRKEASFELELWVT